MNYYKLKGDINVCFLKGELLRLFEVAKKSELLREMRKKGFSFGDLKNDYSKMEKLANYVGERGAQDRNEQ